MGASIDSSGHTYLLIGVETLNDPVQSFERVPPPAVNGPKQHEEERQMERKMVIWNHVILEKLSQCS